MTTRTNTHEYINHAHLVAQVDVSLIETDSAWMPYCSIGDVLKMEAARGALRGGDIETAKKVGCVYEMTEIWISVGERALSSRNPVLG